MPHFKESSSSNTSDGGFEFQSGADSLGIVDDMAYAGPSLSGTSELPLSQQLEPIAVVGMGCRLPGDVKSPSDFWKMMMTKKSGQTPSVPPSRFNIQAHFHENNDRPGSFGVLGGYFINETLQEFDPSFFGITPVEAMWMDPQQRKLLEVVYEAFESAGLTLQQLSGSDTACFMATFTADFQQMSFKEPSFRHSLAATGVDPGLLSNRVSHVFNLRGPSIVVNTACSSSVYAIHNACNALRNKECSAAVVGGSNLMHMNTAKLGVLSPTSTCHTFNSYANGYGRAEGVGAVVLKRLGDAIRDGDPIRGVIRSSATNSNGKAPGVGITYPGFDGQRMVMRKAYQRSGLDPRLTGYFEIHGTGTAIGDPLEVHAVADSMSTALRPSEDGPLHIGAVKTNIGHSEAASGLSALIKAILTVERGISKPIALTNSSVYANLALAIWHFPPTYGVTELNPKMDWYGWKVQVVTDALPFPRHLPVHRVSINSFGYGGTNAHVVVESAKNLLTQTQSYKYADIEQKARRKGTRGHFNRNKPYLLLFSAHEKAALKRNIEAHGLVASHYDLLDLSYTLANRRTHFPSRGMVVTSPATLAKTFTAEIDEFKYSDKKTSGKIGFVFTGQGAQWPRMGAELMRFYPTFLSTIRRLDMVLDELDDAPDWTIEDLLNEDESFSRVNEAEFSQPLCTAIQVALVQMLRSWGITPTVTCGHSSGEIGAAFAAGYITASEAIVLAYYRGKVVRDINTNGAMMAVGLGAEAVTPYLLPFEKEITIACHNSPSGVTLSGNADSLRALQTTLIKESVFARLVKTGGKAYHSSHMAPAAETYEKLVNRSKATLPTELPPAQKAKMVSSVTNTVLPHDEVLDAAYWSANLLSPVLFNQAVQTICTDAQFSDVDVLIEIGPHSALSGPIKQIKAEFGFDKIHYLPSLIRSANCAASLLRLVGELFLVNYAVDFESVTAVEEISPSGKLRRSSGNLIVDLPPYQWDKTKKFWAESRESREQRAPKYPRHDVLGQLTIGGSLAEPTWRNVLRIKDLPWLRDHSLGGEAVFPAAGYFAMAMEAIRQLNETSDDPAPIDCYVLRDVSIQQALVTPDDDNGVEVLLNMRPSRHSSGISEGGNKWWDFNVSSIAEGEFQKNHMSGRISINARRSQPAVKQVPTLTQRATGKSWNQALKQVGFDYGPTFQDMDGITFDGTTYCAHSDTRVKQQVSGMVGESRYVLHPASLDACLQLMIVAIWAGRTNAMQFGAVPVQADEVAIWEPTQAQIKDGSGKAFSWIDPRGARSFNAHSQLVGSDGQVLMEISNMRCAAYEAAIPQNAEEPARPQPYGHVVLKPDVDFLVGAQDMDIPDYVEHAVFKDPGLRVLSLDSAYTASLLSKMPELEITSTDDSTEGVDLLTTQLKGYKNASVKKFDLDSDLAGQVIKANSYELVISPVASATALSKIREILVDGGKAVLKTSEPLSESDLKRAGFGGVQATLRGDGRPVTVATTEKLQTTNGTSGSPMSRTISLIYRDTSPTVTSEIVSALKEQGYEPELIELGTSAPLTSTNILVLADVESNRPLLATITEAEFIDLQRILAAATSALWVTRGDFANGRSPEHAMTCGLLRVLRSEQASLTATVLDVDNETTPTVVVDLIRTLVAKQIHGEPVESEYFSSGGKTLISRLVSHDSINKTYGSVEGDVISTAFDPNALLAGRLQSGKVVFETLEETPLGPEEVEIKVAASSLNAEGVAVVSGTEFTTDFSHEISGTVTKVGSEVTGLLPGDRIVAFSSDKFSTSQRVHHSLTQKLEPTEHFNTMASLPMYYAAALYSLNRLAHLKRGETVLILPGSGHAVTALVKVAQALGGAPIVAVRAAPEAELVATQFDLSREQVVHWSAAEKYGADVVIAPSACDSAIAREAWRSMTPFSRFVTCDAKEASSYAALDTVPTRHGAIFIAFSIISFLEKTELVGDLLKQIVEMYRQGQLPAPPINVRSITELDDSISSFSNGLADAKTVITYETNNSSTIALIPSRPHLKLRDDATYFLVGCLGGLGRSLTSWMMKRGARNFAFLSRSGTDAPQAAALVNDLVSSGANVQVFRGDASIKEDLKQAVSSVPVDRPIRGVINAAMVLRDGMFHSMGFDDWVTSTKPKVQGSMNLHEVMADIPLDFFAMTSSVSGTLGTPGQANYAAGNAFMDSLARLRRSEGKPAAAVILPMVLGIGVVAENTAIEDSLKRKGMYGIDEEAVIEAMEVAIMEQLNPNASTFNHLVVGLDPMLLRKARQEAVGDVDAFWEVDPRFSALVYALEAGSKNQNEGGADSILARVKAAASAADAIDEVKKQFKLKLSRVLMLDIEEFEGEGRSIASYGIDSMIGSELRNWIFKELGLQIAFQQLLGPSLTIQKFSELVCENQGIVSS
ncbi:polyketide synthase [Xylaria palmicola]|nr:polyketide synthase [Xylaria palmicola]